MTTVTVALTPSAARNIGRAMAEQVSRVNEKPPVLVELTSRVKANPEYAASELLRLKAEVAQLKADLAAAQAGAIANAPRWCTPAEAARHLGKHVSSINRALHDGRLNGTQGSNGQWRVALPLPPSLPTRPRGRKRKTS